VARPPPGPDHAPRRTSLEAGVCRRVLALEEDRVEGLRVEVRVERLAIGAAPAVHRPGVGEVGQVGPVPAGVDVVVLGRHHDVIRRGLVVAPGPVVQQLPDVTCHAGAAGDGERPTFTEVVLDVDDDQCTRHAPQASAVPAHGRLGACRAGSRSPTSSSATSPRWTRRTSTVAWVPSPTTPPRTTPWARAPTWDT